MQFIQEVSVARGFVLVGIPTAEMLAPAEDTMAAMARRDGPADRHVDTLTERVIARDGS